MPKELTNRLQNLIDYQIKHQNLYDLETIEILIQYLTDSNITLDLIPGIII